MRSGIVVSFEGISCAGKTTIIDLLHKQLVKETESVVLKSDLLHWKPDEDIGLKIKNILDVGAPTYRLGYPFVETLLICAKRAYESQTKLEPALNDGAIVLCDRDIDTVCAYQLPVLVKHRPFVEPISFIKWIRQTNILSVVKPHLTFYLEVTANHALERDLSSKKVHKLFNKKVYLEEAKGLLKAYEEVFAVNLLGRDLIRINTDDKTKNEVFNEVTREFHSWMKFRE